MNSILSYIRNLALVFWLGEMLFFIVIFAPRVFRVLPRPEAAKLQGEIFPAYYLAGIICGVIVFSVILVDYWLQRSEASVFPTWSALLCSLALVVFAYSYFSLTPQIKELQPLILAETVHPEAQGLFDKLHSLSVRLNGAALIALLSLLKILR